MRSANWRGAALIAATYIYFLIFAQFGFLATLSEVGIAATALKTVMAVMAFSGIAFSLLASWLTTRSAPGPLLRTGFVVCGAAAAAALAHLGLLFALFVAFGVGAGLGIVTVVLVTQLRVFTSTLNPLVAIGVGTGVGYFVCNIPLIFTASPQHQAAFAIFICLAGATLTFAPTGSPSEPLEREQRTTHFGFPQILAGFAVLVWLDSAAFYIIQHTSALKAGTWTGNAHLWINGCTHLLAAVAAALLLRGHRLALVLSCAVVALGFACVLLRYPGLIQSASLFYPVGVSFYSVALVAYPAFLSDAPSTQERAWQASALYAVAGWMGSALGIGMAQNLGYVPPAFVAVAGVVVLGPVFLRSVRYYLREIVLLGATALVGLVCFRLLPAAPSISAQSAVERGRQIYISEGCISCHSQYVRPGTRDEAMWGPTDSMQKLHAQKPPLIGNRRQGPDLAEVGARRSPSWLKAHLIDPAALSYRSAMPSYEFLFRDGRGADLVTYLASLGEPDRQQHITDMYAWEPSSFPVPGAGREGGATTYAQECATCHEDGGTGRTRWQREFSKLPPSLNEMRSSVQKISATRLAQIIKFGIPKTDMPGHEYLEDRQVVALVRWLMPPSAQSVPHS